MKQHESSAATTATEPPVAVAVAAHPRSGSLGSSGNSSKMTLAQIQRQGGDSIALKCARGDAGGDDGGDVLVLGGVGGDD